MTVSDLANTIISGCIAVAADEAAAAKLIGDVYTIAYEALSALDEDTDADQSPQLADLEAFTSTLYRKWHEMTWHAVQSLSKPNAA